MHPRDVDHPDDYDRAILNQRSRNDAYKQVSLSCACPSTASAKYTNGRD